MRYWFDSEFCEHDERIDLISIGIVAENGREYYAESADFDPIYASDWLRENVIPQLQGCLKPLSKIRSEILAFFDPAPTEIWAYFGEYDWFLLRRLIGHMLDWPAGWPLSHMNLEQYRLHLGVEHLPPQAQGQHHALYDARWCHDAWRALRLSSQTQ